MPAVKWSIDKSASRRAQPAVVGRGLSEGLGLSRELGTVIRIPAKTLGDFIWRDGALPKVMRFFQPQLRSRFDQLEYRLL